MCSPGFVAITNSDGYDDCVSLGSLGGSTQTGGVTSGGTSSTPPAQAGGTAGSSSWLSGLGGLFSGLGGLAAGISKAVNAPGGSSASWVYNPATGLYTNPATGQVVTSTGTLSSAVGLNSLVSSPLLLLGLGVLAILLLRKK